MTHELNTQILFPMLTLSGGVSTSKCTLKRSLTDNKCSMLQIFLYNYQVIETIENNGKAVEPQKFHYVRGRIWVFTRGVVIM